MTKTIMVRAKTTASRPLRTLCAVSAHFNETDCLASLRVGAGFVYDALSGPDIELCRTTEWVESLIRRISGSNRKARSAAEAAGATLAFLGKRRLLKLQHFLKGHFQAPPMSYIPEYGVGFCTICSHDSCVNGNDFWISCNLCGSWAHEDCMNKELAIHNVEITRSLQGRVVSALCPACTERSRADQLCVDVTCPDVCFDRLESCVSTLMALREDGTCHLRRKLGNCPENLITSGFHHILYLGAIQLSGIRAQLCDLSMDKSTRNVAVIGPSGIGEPAANDLRLSTTRYEAHGCACSGR